MPDLERLLAQAAAELEWPATPSFELLVAPRPARRRLALVLVAAAVAAVAVAFAVPGARSAILRFFHLEGVTIERVSTLPPAQERSLGSGLGRVVSPAEAARELGRPVALPPVSGPVVLHVDGGVVSALLAGPEPVLLSQFSADAFMLKKLVSGSTGVEGIVVDGAPGFWISGEEHVYSSPTAPARLAGNVLLWARGGIVYRLEGRQLSKTQALSLARQIDGT